MAFNLTHIGHSAGEYRTSKMRMLKAGNPASRAPLTNSSANASELLLGLRLVEITSTFFIRINLYQLNR